MSSKWKDASICIGFCKFLKILVKLGLHLDGSPAYVKTW